MATIYRLNLSENPWPLCLLDCLKELQHLQRGDELEIRIRDQEAFEHLLLMIKRAPVQLLASDRTDGEYRLRVFKCRPRPVAPQPGMLEEE